MSDPIHIEYTLLPLLEAQKDWIPGPDVVAYADIIPAGKDGYYSDAHTITGSMPDDLAAMLADFPPEPDSSLYLFDRYVLLDRNPERHAGLISITLDADSGDENLQVRILQAAWAKDDAIAGGVAALHAIGECLLANSDEE